MLFAATFSLLIASTALFVRLLRLQSVLAQLLAYWIVGLAQVILGCEFLSLFRLLSAPAITVLAAALAGTSSVLNLLFNKRLAAPQRGLLTLVLEIVTEARSRPLLTGMVAVAVVILLVTLLTGLAVPPNNWDSLTYHLPRVGHWLQQGSLSYYPTSIWRQNSSQPGAEEAILWTVALTRSDRLAYVVQWLALVFSLCGVAGIVRRLGGTRAQALFAAALFAWQPMVLLQSTTTQNDLVVTSLVLAATFFAFSFDLRGKWCERHILLPLALSLAVTVKATALTFVPMLVLVALASARRNSDWQSAIKRVLPAALSVAVAALIVTGPMVARSLQASSEGGSQYGDVANETISLQGAFLNATRNAASVAGYPPPLPISPALTAATRSFLTGVGIDPNDPRFTFGTIPFEVPNFPGEDTAPWGPALAFALLIVIVLALSGRLEERSRQEIWAMAAGTLVAFLLFSALKRYSPWNNRLLLPYVAMATPLLGLLLSPEISLRRPRSLLTLAVILSLLPMIAYALLLNPMKPLLGERPIWKASRVEIQTWNRPDVRQAYSTAEQKLPEDARVGLVLGGDDFEHPLFGPRYSRWLIHLLEPGSRIPVSIRQPSTAAGLGYVFGRKELMSIPANAKESTLGAGFVLISLSSK